MATLQCWSTSSFSQPRGGAGYPQGKKTRENVEEPEEEPVEEQCGTKLRLQGRKKTQNHHHPPLLVLPR